MFMQNIITDSHSIFKFLNGFDLDLFLSNPQLKHFTFFLDHMLEETFKVNLSSVKYCHRTTFGRFLTDSPWDEKAIEEQFQSCVLSCIYNRSHQTKQRIYVLIDDTTFVKTKPSSPANHPIQGCGWHYSHLHHQNIYGHQWVTLMLQCDELILPYQIIPYEKEKRTKIEIVQDVLINLPKPPSNTS